MPIINLGPLGQFRLHRLKRADESPLPTRTDRSSSPESAGKSRAATVDNADRPPSYTALPIMYTPTPQGIKTHQYHDHQGRQTANEVNWYSPAKANKPVCRVRQIRRYLIEIVALMLDADFDMLNGALYNEKGVAKTNSVLSATEREELLALSCQVTRAHGRHAQKISIDYQDQQDLCDMIIEPAKDFGMWVLGLFALDLIAWYGEPLTRPIPWSETIPGYFRTHVIPIVDHDPIRSMRSLCALIPYIAMKEEVGTVLIHAFEKCCQREGYGVVDLPNLYTPTRFGYHYLFHDVLDRPYDGARTRICNKRYGSKWHDCVCRLEFPVGDAAAVEEEQEMAELVEARRVRWGLA